MLQSAEGLKENEQMLNRAGKFVTAAVVIGWALAGACQTEVFEKKTEVVMLGTGAPYADPDRFGPATAIVVHGTPYLVDCGPGVIRRVAQAHKNGVAGLTPQRIGVVFITHLHSDHTVGLPDVMLTPAVTGRPGGLEIYGPAGMNDMTASILQAWKKDIDIRLHGLEHGNPRAYVMHPHEIKAGVVYKDENVTVTAFLVKHGTWDESWGYRFDTPEKSIVISGDTAPTDAIAKNCHGCDVLIHEVYSTAGLKREPEGDREYHRRFHTSTVELAKIAEAAKPKLLVLDHVLFWKSTPQDVLDEMKAAGYTGKAVLANDLDVF
jgi:ribonuclease BN (tRNA processing enzyme)